MPGPTPKIREQVETAMRSGVSFSRAMGLAGYSPESGRLWRKRGEQELDGDAEPSEYGRFALMVRIQMSDRVALAESVIHSAMASPPEDLSTKDHLHHARWVASRLAKETWGDSVEVRVRAGLQSLVDRLEPVMSTEGYAELIRCIAVVAGMDIQKTVGNSGSAGAEDPGPVH